MNAYPSTSVGSWAAFGRVLIAMLLFTVSVAAQPVSTLRGRVSNQQTGVYLEGARVEIQGTDLVALTESDGSFHFPAPPPGPVTLVISYTGLDSKTLRVDPAQASNVEIPLTSQVYALEAYTVS